MIEQIIVPVDGSVLSEQALPFATLLARSYGCPVVLAHVVELPMYVTIDDPVAFVAMDALQDYLNSLTDRAPRDLTARTVIRSGRPHSELLALADETPGSMIVMATHGRGGVPRALLGSVADKVVHESNVPVGLVRAASTMPVVPDRLRTIAIPLDGSELSEAAFLMGVDLAGRTEADLELVRVVEPLWAAYAGEMHGMMVADARLIDDMMEEMEIEARTALDSLASAARRKGLAVEWSVEFGRPLSEILRFAVEKRADVILTTTHGRGGLSRMVFGSVTTALINQSPVPLIVIPAHALGGR